MKLNLIHTIVIICVMAISLYASLYPSDVSLGGLKSLKVGLILFASFQARYGRGKTADWWFGFAAFGWASVMLSALELPYFPAHRIARTGYWDLFHPGVTLGQWIEDRDHLPGSDHRGQVRMAEAARYWLTLLAALVGGLLSLQISRRRKAIPPE